MTIPGIFSQRDSRWANDELGYNNSDGSDPSHYYNLYHFGCAITALANVLWWNGNGASNPGGVNSWLRDNKGFEPGGGNLIWDAFKPLLDQVDMVYRGYSSDLNAVNAVLKDENVFAIAWITKPGFPMHFSAMPYVGMIADSWDAVLKPIGSYTFHGAHLYSKNVPVHVTPPPPEVAPVLPPVMPPIIVATPVPLPSVEVPVPQPVNPPQPTILAPEPPKPPVQDLVQPLEAAQITGPTITEINPTVPLVLPVDALLTDLMTGEDVARVPKGTPFTVAAVSVISGHTFLLSAHGQDHLQGIHDSYFVALTVPSVDGLKAPAKDTVIAGIEDIESKWWQAVLRFLHRIHK